MSNYNKYQTEGERPLRTTPVDFDKFMKGSIWSDILYTIKDRVDLLTMALIQCSDVNELMQLKGEIKAWKELQGLPSHLKSCADAEIKAQTKTKDIE